VPAPSTAHLNVARAPRTSLRAPPDHKGNRASLHGGGACGAGQDLAGQEGVTDAYVCRLLPLTCLAPDIVEGILAVGSTWDVTSK
jgi:hypothetical protein